MEDRELTPQAFVEGVVAELVGVAAGDGPSVLMYSLEAHNATKV